MYRIFEKQKEVFDICNQALVGREMSPFPKIPAMKITVQGGIGTANEDNFLLEHYDLDGTGWASPFLLVPEATNVDDATLKKMANAQKGLEVEIANDGDNLQHIVMIGMEGCA